MLFVITTYNRESMLMSLIEELAGREVLIIDDGSEWSNGFDWMHGFRFDPVTQIQYIRTNHEGKCGFWKKWLIAQQIALGTRHEHFVFLPDDITGLDLETIDMIQAQEWDSLFAFNLMNEGERFRWGEKLTGQPDVIINGKTFRECCYVDGCFITNRYTLEAFEVEPVSKSWFNRGDISSGVGYQITKKLTALGCPMLKPIETLAYHGDHDSVMHREHRKQNPLITK